jgi:hypothetical protein
MMDPNKPPLSPALPAVDQIPAAAETTLTQAAKDQIPALAETALTKAADRLPE